MPSLYGLHGVWFSAPIADIISCTVAGYVLLKELKTLSKIEAGCATAERAV